jgi:hypothetical protein
MSPKPRRPRSSNPRRQHDVIPQTEELINVDIKPNVSVSSFPENLLIHSGSINRVGEVVLQLRSAPSDVMWQVHPSCGFDKARIVDVIRDGDRPGRRSKLSATTPCHRHSVGLKCACAMEVRDSHQLIGGAGTRRHFVNRPQMRPAGDRKRVRDLSSWCRSRPESGVDNRRA